MRRHLLLYNIRKPLSMLRLYR